MGGADENTKLKEGEEEEEEGPPKKTFL